MRKPTIALRIKAKEFDKIIDLGNTVIAGMTGNLSFTTPAPTLADLQSAITDLINAKAKRGTKSHHGTTEDTADLKAKGLTALNMLKAEAQYVMNQAEIAAGNDYVAMLSILESSGFTIAATPTPKGILQMVQNLHEFVSRKMEPNQKEIRWKKPLNVYAAGDLKVYKVSYYYTF